TVSGNAVVVVMTSEFPYERAMLLRNRTMSIESAPFDNPLQSSSETAAHGLALHHPVASPGPAPEMREAKKVEAAAFTLAGRTSEVDQSRLRRVEREPVPRESLREYSHHALRVRFSLEDHDGVIGVSDQTG